MAKVTKYEMLELLKDIQEWFELYDDEIPADSGLKEKIDSLIANSEAGEA